MCCNFVIESEVGIAMRDLTRCSEQTKNEAMEQTDLRTAARLTFADHMDRFVTGDRAPCSERMNENADLHVSGA